VKTEELEAVLGYRFRRRDIAETACRHASLCLSGAESNERLEFLGDAVLGLVVAEWLYGVEPRLDEGEMTRGRALCVCGGALAEAARRFGLARFLRVGKNMDEIPERVLAGFVEALIAAVYLDGGLNAARKVVTRLLGEHLAQVAQQAKGKDYKSLLQEWSLKSCAALPTYRVISEDGPPHRRVYEVEVEVCGEVCGKGEGRSKKEAEQAAAQQALFRITTQKEGQEDAHKRSPGCDTQNIY